MSIFDTGIKRTLEIIAEELIAIRRAIQALVSHAIREKDKQG